MLNRSTSRKKHSTLVKSAILPATMMTLKPQGQDVPAFATEGGERARPWSLPVPAPPPPHTSPPCQPHPTCGLASLAPVFQPWGFLFDHSGELGLDSYFIAKGRPVLSRCSVISLAFHLQNVDSAPFSLVIGIMPGHAALNSQQRTRRKQRK